MDTVHTLSSKTQTIKNNRMGLIISTVLIQAIEQIVYATFNVFIPFSIACIPAVLAHNDFSLSPTPIIMDTLGIIATPAYSVMKLAEYLGLIVIAYIMDHTPLGTFLANSMGLVQSVQDVFGCTRRILPNVGIFTGFLMCLGNVDSTGEFNPSHGEWVIHESCMDALGGLWGKSQLCWGLSKLAAMLGLDNAMELVSKMTECNDGSCAGAITNFVNRKNEMKAKIDDALDLTYADLYVGPEHKLCRVQQT